MNDAGETQYRNGAVEERLDLDRRQWHCRQTVGESWHDDRGDEETIGNNNLIRVVIGDPVRRDYVYKFLSSPLGQILLMRNVYGTNQDHIEPEDVRNIPIPIPRDGAVIKNLHEQVREVSTLKERAAELEAAANSTLASMFDAALARANEELETENGDGALIDV